MIGLAAWTGLALVLGWGVCVAFGFALLLAIAFLWATARMARILVQLTIVPIAQLADLLGRLVGVPFVVKAFARALRRG